MVMEYYGIIKRLGACLWKDISFVGCKAHYIHGTIDFCLGTIDPQMEPQKDRF
jgi:hypothetical protein